MFYTLTIKEIITETKDAVSIVFDIPNAIKELFQFKAGQYVTLKKEINTDEVRRAYSICSSPKSGELKVAIKRVENGVFSTYATTLLKAGDDLEVAVPEGKFVLETKAGKNYLGFAAGSGITPILSMIKEVLEADISSTFTLIYGNKKADSTLFYSELNALKKQYPNQFKLSFVFSRENPTDALFGRIDKGNVNYFIKNFYKKMTFDNVFLCGPEEMINTVSETLEENGYDKNNINYELFTASTETNDNTDIPEGQSEITVVLDDEKTTFSIPQNSTLLSEILRHKLDAPYSCQGGVCSSCIGKVTEGKAVMFKNSILTDEEIKEGLVLTCCAHATTPKLTLDFDEV